MVCDLELPPGQGCHLGNCVAKTLRFRRLRFGEPLIVDLKMGLFRGAVFHHFGCPELPIGVNMGRFRSLMGRFPTSMGRFPKCLNGPFSLGKIPGKTL